VIANSHGATDSMTGSPSAREEADVPLEAAERVRATGNCIT